MIQNVKGVHVHRIPQFSDRGCTGFANDFEGQLLLCREADQGVRSRRRQMSTALLQARAPLREAP